MLDGTYRPDMQPIKRVDPQLQGEYEGEMIYLRTPR